MDSMTEIEILDDNETLCIDYVQNDEISYWTFFSKYMIKNIPCVVKGISNQWKCSNQWVTNDKINYDYFIEHYGKLTAPVANCEDIAFNSQNKEDTSVTSYMEYLKTLNRKDILYLKDWHLQRTCPSDNFYEVPALFSSDWLNEFAIDKHEDDFMFVYIGPENSWTPLHADVYNSYSWSVNIVGKKRWLLFPPGEELKLQDSLGNLPLLFNPEEFKDVKYIEVIQGRGDAIFVPSGWYHQVENLFDTISINHNWINGCNISYVYKAMLLSLETVEKEIYDLLDSPDYASNCQLILNAQFGMDFERFGNFLCYIGEKRLKEYIGTKDVKFKKYILGIKHIRFDLKRIYNVLTSIAQDETYFNKCSCPNIKPKIMNCKNSIYDKLLHT